MWILTGALLATSLAAAPVMRAATDLPAWSVGDSWTYRGIGLAYGLGLLWTQVTVTVAGMDSFTENGTSFSAYHTETWWNATGVPPVQAADEWYRTSDLAVARFAIYYHPCTNIPSPIFCGNTTVTATPEPPLPIRFPLTAPDAWSANTWVVLQQENRDTGATSWDNYTGGANDSVALDETVAVPYGNLTATPLTVTYQRQGVHLLYYYDLYYSSWTVIDYSATVGNAVQVIEYAPSLGGGFYPRVVLQLSSYHRSQTGLNAPVLGLPIWSWLALAAVVAAVAAVVLLRRRPPRPAPSTAPEPSPAKP